MPQQEGGHPRKKPERKDHAPSECWKLNKRGWRERGQRILDQNAGGGGKKTARDRGEGCPVHRGEERVDPQ